MKKRKWSDVEIEEYRRQHNMYFFYYNEDDGNLLVPKPNLFGMRWTVRWVTFNWAHPIAQIFLFALITLILLPVIYNAFGIRLGKQ